MCAVNISVFPDDALFIQVVTTEPDERRTKTVILAYSAELENTFAGRQSKAVCARGGRASSSWSRDEES